MRAGEPLAPRCRLRVAPQREAWAEPQIAGHKSEDELQALLATSPDLLPGSETGLPMAVARELSVAPGRIDVVGVDVDGQLTLCECKLAANPGARREVVGQLLEYAGALRGMDFDDFSARFEARAGRPLLVAVSDIAGEGFDEEAFLAQVAENLEAGRFRLVVVVDRITDALKQTVTYLNDHLDGPVIALELAYLRDGEVEMLIPAVYGEEIAERKEPARRAPVVDADTVIVAARAAYLEYQETNAYVCQPGRRFREDIKYLGFYKDKAIQREVPLILHRRDGVVFSGEEARSLSASDDKTDNAIGEVITRSLESGWRVDEGQYQVFLLSGREDETTLVLPHPIRNTSRGAWTQGQRYTSSAALRCGASTSDELAAEGG
jgi:hypothetical protein